jgi:4-hydroxybenzoate polyprenyltransferase
LTASGEEINHDLTPRRRVIMLLQMFIDIGNQSEQKKSPIPKRKFYDREEFNVVVGMFGIFVGGCLLFLQQNGIWCFVGGFIAITGMYFLYKDYADAAQKIKNPSPEKHLISNKKRTIMKNIAILQSLLIIGLLVWAIFSVAQDKNDNDKWIPILLFLFLLVSQIFNIFALRINANQDSKSWLGLYFERKKLEEKKKIENLTKKN